MTVKNQVNEPIKKNEENENKQNHGFLNNYSLEKNEASKSLFFNNKAENTDVKQTGSTQTNTTKNIEENKINSGSSFASNTAPQTNLFSSSSTNTTTNTSSNNLSSVQSKPSSLFNSSNPFTNCSKPAESMFSTSIQTNQSNFPLN